MGGALGLGGHGLGLAQQLSQPLELHGIEHQSNNNSTLSNYQQFDVADNQSGEQQLNDNGTRRPQKLRNLFKQRDMSMEKYRVNIGDDLTNMQDEG